MSMLMTPSLDDLDIEQSVLEGIVEQMEGEENVIAAVTPVTIGPTWMVDEDGNWLLPEHTLGWEIAEWCAEYLNGVGGGPWQFTLEQLRFVLWWYAVNDEGRFIYRTGVLQRMKGWGKDPLLAVMCLVEFAGPSRFAGWAEDGSPIGAPAYEPWVQVTAVNQDQTRNTMNLIPTLMTDAFQSRYAVKDGIERIRGRVGGSFALIEAVTSSPRALEGKRPTFTLLNEALDVNTAIPTPDRGFVRMGDLEVGDLVYGKDGVPVEVTYVTEEQNGRACFKVSLPNGEFIVASEGHLWGTKVASSAAKPRVRTTLEMVQDGRRFMIPRAGVRHSENTPLPVDPYLLGLWLGDGSTGKCNIAVGAEDVEATRNELLIRGIETHEVGARKDGTCRISFSNKKGFGADMGGEVAKAMRLLPCYRDKHIPDEYMMAGHEQRLELLRGLMDSGGHVSKDGYCTFVGRERLAADVFELAASLGFLPYRKFVKDERSREGGCWRINFLLEGENPFSMPRKRDRAPVKKRREWVTVDIEQVPTVPVRCIGVNEKNNLFQAGMSFVTHNTHHWVANNKGHLMFETLDGNSTKLGNRYLAITNAYLPGEDSIAERMRDQWQDIEDGNDEKEDFLYDSLEASPTAPLSGPLLPEVLKRIRGDAIWSPIEDIVSSIMNKTIAPARSRRMWLNQIVSGSDSLHDIKIWLACEDDALRSMAQSEGPLGGLRDGDEVVMGMDGSKRHDSTAIVLIRVRDRAVFLFGLWEAPQVIMSKQDEEWEVDRAEVDSAVAEVFRRFKVKAFYSDVAQWETYIDKWTQEYGDTLAVTARQGHPIAWDMRISLKESTFAHERLMDAIWEQRIVHNGDRRLRRHVLNAQRRENNFGVYFGKETRSSRKKVDAYAALMLAHEAIVNYGQRSALHPEKPKTKRGYFL